VRRNTELGLLILVCAITGAAYALASLGKDAELPADIGPFLLVIVGLLLFANLVTRRTAPQANPVLLPVAGLLNGLGYVFIARIDESLAVKQAGWTALGVGAFAGTLWFVRRARDLASYRWTAALVGLVLLLLPLVPGLGYGGEEFGSQIWVRIGPVNFQPGEFAKIALAVFFAGYLVEKRELLAMGSWGVGPVRIPDPKHLGPVLVAWGASLVVMVAQRDLGSSLLFFTLFLVMLWVSTQRGSYLAVGSLLFAGGATFAWRQFAHVRQRVDIWLDPWADPKGDGFQIVEAAFAVADGGLTGTGIGLSGRVGIPAAETDFIIAVIAQELGLFGATVVLVSFLLLLGSGLGIAQRATDAFDTLLATGLSALLGVQAFIIMAGVTRLLPLTGVTLPFVSYGGSSLLANYVLLALLLRISDETEAGVVQPRPGAARKARRRAARNERVEVTG
jgi:peptidoglycan glycosyltransferase